MTLINAINFIKSNPNMVRETYGDTPLFGVRCVVFAETFRDFIDQVTLHIDELIAMGAKQKWDESFIEFPDGSWIRSCRIGDNHRVRGIRCDAVFGCPDPDVCAALISEPWSMRVH